jgi:hypothetical protein
MFALYSSGVTGAVDATYDPTWLVDGRTGWPVRKTGTGGAWTITGPAQDIDVLCVGHHTIRPAATVAISGGLTDTIVIPAWPSNNIPFNGVKVRALVAGVTSLTLTVSGNTEPAVIIGEFCAGLSKELPVTLTKDTEFSVNDFKVARPIDMAFVPPHDKAMEARRWRGTALLTLEQLADVEDWQRAQRAGTRPSLIIKDWPTANDAQFVDFVGLTSVVPRGPLMVKVEMVFQEFPRGRW